MSDSYEDMRRKELAVQEKQLFAQRVTAVASVANAAAAHKQAAAVEEMREQMAANAEREAEHRREMAAQQRQMADEQRLANFRNTVLSTLPLLKSEEDKTQFLTEQLLPKLKEKVDVKIYGPLELICQWFTAESQMVTTHLKNEVGLDLNEFLLNGQKITSRIGACLSKSAQREKQAKELVKAWAELNKVSRLFCIMDLVKIVLWMVLYFWIFGLVGIMFESLLPQGRNRIFVVTVLGGIVAASVITHFFFKNKKISSRKVKVFALTPKDDGSALVRKFSELRKESELQKEKWESYKPQIVEYTINKFKDYINSDARSLLAENVVAPQLESGLQEVQSFLPPSSRLPAKHFAKFFFSESDVRECTENQLNIKKQLELAIEPFYKSKTVVLLLDRVGHKATTGKNGAVIKQGSLVEMWRHDDGNSGFATGPQAGMEGTVWKVLELSDDSVNLELVTGKYSYEKPVFTAGNLRYEKVVNLPGYSAKFSSCEKYLREHPGCKGNEQTLKEWRPVNS